MTIWFDANLSPRIAVWASAYFSVSAHHIEEFGLRHTDDASIFHRAKNECVDILITKNGDFPMLLAAHGPPPAILWLRIGNTSNERPKEALTAQFSEALQLFRAGISLVEMTDRRRG